MHENAMSEPTVPMWKFVEVMASQKRSEKLFNVLRTCIMVTILMWKFVEVMASQ